MSRPDVTYPPLDVPKPVADDLWVVDSGPMLVLGLIPIPLRMTLVRLPDGSLLLHSPTRFDPELGRRLQEIGPIRQLVAPNSAHWTFVEAWQRQVPEATTWAAAGLRERRQVQRSGVRLDHDLDAVPPREWGGSFAQIDVPGLGGFREICLFHRNSRSLLLTDLVQNLEPSKLPLSIRPFAALAGVTAPDGKAPAYLRAIVRLKGDPAREAARRLVALEPERVIFTHGRWFDEDAAARLERSLRWLL
jgi:Domain of unknown function (DUF4336)